ncbi:MAG: hypothetical protein A2285_00170 [Elusimicrobia bacterium RIFOXYA12_FULL_57_11]|nr:MAG: hypothetical protein A2285_00170 [Elusimicrobia bacterium RIFOXYA12_FULL_57_11]
MKKKETLTGEEWALVAVFAVSLFVKIPFLAAIHGDPAFVLPIVDSLEFHSWAREIMLDWAGGWTAIKTHPPLYAYFVAVIYSAIGYSTLAVAAVQYVMFSISTALVYLISARLFGRAAALFSCALMTFYWFFLCTQSFLYSENLSLFLNLCCAACLLFMADSRKKFIISGVLLGLSAACRAEILVVAALISVWFLAGAGAVKNPVKAYGLFLCGVALALAPVMARNYAVSDRLVFRSLMGANLYLGSNPAFNGTSVFLETGKQWKDFMAIPDKAANKKLTDLENDRYFIAETGRLIGKAPRAWAKFAVSKITAVWTGTEFLRTEDVYVLEKYFPARPYFRLIRLELIFVSAFIGMVFSFSRARRFLLAYVFILSWVVFVVFPLKTRYFVPVLPFLILFSGFGLARLYEALRRRQLLAASAAGGVIIFFLLLAAYNPLKPQAPDASETYYAIAKNYAEMGDEESASKFFLACLRLNPGNSSAMNDYGALLMDAGRDTEAVGYFKWALEADGADQLARDNYEKCLEKIRAAGRG